MAGSPLRSPSPSILFPQPPAGGGPGHLPPANGDAPPPAAAGGGTPLPAYFADLNLDQVLAAMSAGRDEYRLAEFFCLPLHDADAVAYRQQVMRDLEREPVAAAVRAFAARMRRQREQLAQAGKLHYEYQQQRWFLDAAATYCEAVGSLARDLSGLRVESRGLQDLREYLAGYVQSGAFTTLVSGIQAVTAGLDAVSYSVHIKGNRVRVTTSGGEPDYSAAVEETFAKFKQGAVRDYRVSFREPPDMNHVEAQVLACVARLYPGEFSRLADFCARHEHYADAVVTAFDRQVQFCLAYLELIEPLKRAGLPFCYPRVTASASAVRADGAFDLALACKLVPDGKPVTGNGFELTAPERIIVVTGPNQGGKTTFARAFGQLHHLASLGLPVPGRHASLTLPDQIYTHFEREEDITTLRGKLEDELARIHQILRQATSRSVLVMNESFTSTTLSDALSLGTEVMRQITELGLLCVYVTFVDELSTLNDATVSMVAAIAAGNPAGRTYRIERRPADGLAYAAAIADRYGLSYERVKERIGS
jgi:DNA mismatch repair protein MutS